MRQALRRFGGQTLVDAEDAISEEDYVCPACRNPVFKRSGATRAACFAHKTGYGSEACELFFSIQGVNLGCFTPSEEHAALTTRPWNIALALKLGADRGNVPGWGLILSIPTPGISSGSLSVDVGGRVQDIDLNFNQYVTRIVVAEPHLSNYRVLAVSPQYGPLDNHLLKECDGLRQGCTAFGHLAQSNQLVRRATEIYPGQDYVLVWPSHMQPSIPEDFEVRPIEAYKGWDGAIVHIPGYLRDYERRWLSEMLELPVRRPLPSIISVWPPLCERSSPKTIDVARSRNFLFAVDSLDGQSAAVFVKDRDRVQVVNVSNVPSTILGMEPECNEEFKIVVRASNEAEVLVRQSYRNFAWQAPGLYFTFSQGDAVSTLSACDSRLSSLMNSVRQGLAELISSRGPLICKVVARNRIKGLWNNLTEIDCNGSEVAGLVRGVLQCQGEVQLDFGAYGHALVEQGIVPDEEVPLPSRVRKLILGYLHHFPHSPHRTLNYKSLSDGELVAKFHALSPTPSSLSQHRALAKILKVLPT